MLLIFKYVPKDAQDWIIKGRILKRLFDIYTDLTEKAVRNGVIMAMNEMFKK